MKSRLEELLRQREILREHAAWLEREIAAAGAPGGPASPEGIPAPAPVPVPPAVVPPTPIVTVEPDIKGLHDEVRRGCFLYFFIAAIVLGAVVAFIYWNYQPGNDAAEPTSQPDLSAPSPP